VEDQSTFLSVSECGQKLGLLTQDMHHGCTDLTKLQIGSKRSNSEVSQSNIMPLLNQSVENVDEDKLARLYSRTQKESVAERVVEKESVDQRIVEVRWVSPSKLIDVALIFENFPTWMMGLEPSRIRHIHILGFDSQQMLLDYLGERGHPTQVLQRLLQRFGGQRVYFHSSRHHSVEQDVTLVRVSLSYISSIVATVSTVSRHGVIGVLDHHFYGRLRKGRPSGVEATTHGSPLCWTKICHESVGGVSTFVALFCSPVKLEPEITMLQRTLKHVVDHAVRPSCIRMTDVRFTSALTLKDRIHPSNLMREFVYPTHFCCTGWGFRSLTLGELSQVYGLPMLCRTGVLSVEDFEPLLPAQIFYSLQDELSASAGGGTQMKAVTHPKHTKLPLFSFPCSTRSWIVAVGKWLSHDWIDTTQVTLKAAKRDDALVATDMWNKRLMLLYPTCTVLHLSTLRNWLLCRVRRLVLRGLRSYLLSRYGFTWAATLGASRRCLTSVNNGDISSCLQGGISGSGVVRLVQDADRGCDVVTRFTDATWWEWTRGSALVFWRWGDNTRLALDGCPPISFVEFTSVQAMDTYSV
jgi:hypothetical protein